MDLEPQMEEEEAGVISIVYFLQDLKMS